MKKALKEAKKAAILGDVPIGCIIVKEDHIISSAHNQKEIDNIATHHAEVLAINKACQQLKTWHLEECILYTTVEPCMMCTGAIIQSRISKVVYGTSNNTFGYLNKISNSKINIVPNILEEDCKNILSTFFKEKRNHE